MKNKFSGIKEISVKKISTTVNMIDYSIILHNFLELHVMIYRWIVIIVKKIIINLIIIIIIMKKLKRAKEAKRNWIISKLFTIL